MAQITIKDAAGANHDAALVEDTGRAAAADSMPVALATDDSTALGNAASSAASIDTKSSTIAGAGVATAGSVASIDTKASTGNASLASIDGKVTTGNASLATIATKTTDTATAAGSLDTKATAANASLASVDGKLPALGVHANAGSVSVAPSSDGVFKVAAAGTVASKAGTTTGASQQFAAANAARRGFAVQAPPAHDLYINKFGAAAAADGSSLLVPAGSYYETAPGAAGVAQVNLLCADTGVAYYGEEW